MLANSRATVSNDLSKCKAGTTCAEKRGPRYALAGEIVRTADVSLMPTPSLRCVVGKITSGSITDLNWFSPRSRRFTKADKIPDTLLGTGRNAEFLWIDRRLLKLVLYMRDL